MERNPPNPSREGPARDNGPPEAQDNVPLEEFTLTIRGRAIYRIHLAIQRFFAGVLRRAFAAEQGGGQQGGHDGERDGGGVHGAEGAGDGGQGGRGEAARQDGGGEGGEMVYFRPWE